MENVLVVDDHPGNIRIIAEMLKTKYNILAANNGQRAIRIAEEHTPDIILMDVMMPELDGFTACEMLKKNPKTKEIPVVFITAKNEIDDIVRGFTVGGCDYITKPFYPEELFARVSTHIELQHSRKLLKTYIADLEQKNDELDRMSTTDYLTGLSNRRYMMERLKEEEARSSRGGIPMAILMCDIDRFKRVNDTYGHEFGDLVIREVTGIICDNTREYDVLSRWGGEEFLLLLPETNLDGAVSVAEKIRKAVERKTITSGKSEYNVTLTIGAALYDHSVSISDNINNADEALYEGKDAGRNKTLVYRSQMLI